MRNRTELVTTTLPGSENEEDASEVDSEEDWKPEKKVCVRFCFRREGELNWIQPKKSSLNAYP